MRTAAHALMLQYLYAAYSVRVTGLNVARLEVVAPRLAERLPATLPSRMSRRITDEHRLIYKIADDEIRIAACRYHYGS